MCKSWYVLKGPICKNSYFSFPTRQIPTQRDAGWPVQTFHPKQQYLKVQFEKKKKVDLWVSFPSSNYNVGILCFFLLIWNYEQNQARSFSLLFSLILRKAHLLCSWKIQMKFKKCFSKPAIRKISYILSCLCHKGRYYRPSPKEFKSLLNAVRNETLYVSVATETRSMWRAFDIICLCHTQAAS